MALLFVEVGFQRLLLELHVDSTGTARGASTHMAAIHQEQCWSSSVLLGERAARPRVPPVARFLSGFRSAGQSTWLLAVVWGGRCRQDISSGLGSAEHTTLEITPRC